MKRLIWALSLCGLFPLVSMGDSEDLVKIDPAMGNWEGEWSDENSGAVGAITAKIVARGRGMYTANMEAEVNGELLPFVLDLKPAEEGKLDFEGKLQLGDERGGESDYEIKIEDGELNGLIENAQVKVTLDLKRLYKKPPTLGAAPPEGAVVLLDGKNLDGFTRINGSPTKWKLVDGAMQVARGGGNTISKEKFLDHELHVEFRTPFMPLMRGQARGNSGVYIGGNFELQVLDSFGEKPADNEAGGIYQVAVPTENASLPPGEWQVYDITYYAPRTDDKGNVTTPGELTVVYNGVKIHDKIVVKGPTPGGIGGSIGKEGPLLLQDHGNPVEFRNIWAKRLPPKGESEEKK